MTINQALRIQLSGVTAYRNILALPVMEKLLSVCKLLEEQEGEAEEENHPEPAKPLQQTPAVGTTTHTLHSCGQSYD